MLGPEAERALVEWAGGGGGGGVVGWGCLHGPVRSLGGGVRHRVLHLRGRERRC